MGQTYGITSTHGDRNPRERELRGLVHHSGSLLGHALQKRVSLHLHRDKDETSGRYYYTVFYYRPDGLLHKKLEGKIGKIVRELTDYIRNLEFYHTSGGTLKQGGNNNGKIK